MQLEDAADVEDIRAWIAQALRLAAEDDAAVTRALAARRAVVVLEGGDGLSERAASAARAWVRGTTSSLLVVTRARLPGGRSTLELGPLDPSTSAALFSQRVEDLGGTPNPAQQAVPPWCRT